MKHFAIIPAAWALMATMLAAGPAFVTEEMVFRLGESVMVALQRGPRCCGMSSFWRGRGPALRGCGR